MGRVVRTIRRAGRRWLCGWGTHGRLLFALMAGRSSAAHLLFAPCPARHGRIPASQFHDGQSLSDAVREILGFGKDAARRFRIPEFLLSYIANERF